MYQISGFNGTVRHPTFRVIGCHNGVMPKRASARFPVQPITPLGPDQVNVLLLLPGMFTE
jgi:hypothetical protein